MEKEYRFKETKLFRNLVYIGLAYLPLLFAYNLLLDRDFRLMNSALGFLFNPYSMLWVGFYSSYYMLKDLRKNIVGFLLFILNIAIILIYLAIGLIGGFRGLLLILFYTIIPIIPVKLLVYLLERSKNKDLEVEEEDEL